MPSFMLAPLRPFRDVRSSLPPGRLINLEGQHVHVEDRGHGPPLLLLHGFAASTYSFRHLFPCLVPDHRVTAVDWNGFGLTERPRDPDAYTPLGQVRFLVRVLDRLGVDSCSIAGQSYGAILGLLLARSHPDRVNRLVLISPVTEFGRAPWWLRLPPGRSIGWLLVRHLLSRPDRFREILLRAFHQKERVTDEVVEAYRSRLLIEGTGRAFHAFTRGSSRPELPAEDLFELVRPTLVVAGRHDDIVAPDVSFRPWNRHPLAEAVTLEESGHSGPEEEPETLARHLRTFLRPASRSA